MIQYGDNFHDYLSDVHPTKDGDPVLKWCKDGYCRQVLALPNGTLIPIDPFSYEKVAMINDREGTPLYKAWGRGASKLPVPVAKKILEGELEDFQKRLAGGEWIVEAIRRQAEGYPPTMRPYHWYEWSPLSWCIAAHYGLAVRYDKNEKGEIEWKFCSPEEARAVAEVPISAGEYIENLEEAIASL